MDEGSRPIALFIAACLAVAALMLAADPSPQEAGTLDGVGQDGRFALLCLVDDVRESRTGHVLDLTDADGHPFQAYLPASLPVPEVGSVVKISAERSEDDPAFLFIRDIAWQDAGKN